MNSSPATEQPIPILPSESQKLSLTIIVVGSLDKVNLSIPRSDSVASLKTLLRLHGQFRLIYCGKLLLDSDIIGDVISPDNLNIHMVQSTPLTVTGNTVQELMVNPDQDQSLLIEKESIKKLLDSVSRPATSQGPSNIEPVSRTPVITANLLKGDDVNGLSSFSGDQISASSVAEDNINVEATPFIFPISFSASPIAPHVVSINGMLYNMATGPAIVQGTAQAHGLRFRNTNPYHTNIDPGQNNANQLLQNLLNVPNAAANAQPNAPNIPNAQQVFGFEFTISTDMIWLILKLSLAICFLSQNASWTKRAVMAIAAFVLVLVKAGFISIPDFSLGDLNGNPGVQPDANLNDNLNPEPVLVLNTDLVEGDINAAVAGEDGDVALGVDQAQAVEQPATIANVISSMAYSFFASMVPDPNVPLEL